MDEVKTLEADLTNNGEGSANRVNNGEIQPQINNCQVFFGESLPKQSFETKDGSTGQDHVQEDGHVDKDHCQESSPKGYGHVKEDDSTGQRDDHTGQTHVPKDSSAKQLLKSKSVIDTTAPFESVKEAVSMFSGIVDWKAHKIQMAERRKRVAQELRKAHEEIPFLKKKCDAAEESKQQVLKELDNAKRRVEELKLTLETAQTEESEAKQDAELIKLRVEEMEQGIADESSLSVKAQLEVAQARHQAAVSELKTLKLELKNLQKDYTLLVSDKDLAKKNAEEAVFTCEKTETYVEDLTIKLITTTQALESVHGAYLEAEENRTEVDKATEQDGLIRYEELQQSQEEWEKISQQSAETEDLNSKLDTALVLVQDLKAELASYMGENHIDIQSAVDIAKTDLKELKLNIEKTTDEARNMKVYANSLNSELGQEKATLMAIKQNEWTEEVVIASLEADLMGTISEVAVIQMKEKETQLEKAAEDAKEAKSRTRKARKELKKARKAANEAKKREHEVMSKLNAAVREVEAARASERLANGAISAVEESKWGRSNESESESENITLSAEKYDTLSQKAMVADDEAKDRVSKAISQIDVAKESELKTVKKFEQVQADVATKKELLWTTRQEAEKAKEGKVMVEQEVRIRKSERRKTKEDDKFERKKKRSLISRICMCLCRKRGRHSNK